MTPAYRCTGKYGGYMRLPALTCRSYYSLLRAPLSVAALLDRAAQLGYSALALADVNAMYGLADFLQTARKTSIQPIIGVEILTDRQHATLIAETSVGYRNLCRITSARNIDPDFCLVRALSRHHMGVIVICSQPSLLGKLQPILQENYLFAPAHAPIDWAGLPNVKSIAASTFNILDDADIPIAKVLHKIRSLSVAGPGPADPTDFTRLISEPDLRCLFQRNPQAIHNAEQIQQRCNFDPLKGPRHLPKVKLPPGKTADRELARLCHIGLARRYNPLPAGVVRRMETELAVIRKNRFTDYFLVVGRIVDFARQNGIPNEVRGSAAGSLVAHCMGFTRVCPIENRLYFERFMNPGRTDCPDIDIDLCWRRRDEVIDFCYKNWGLDHVAMICNINRYRRRSALRDVARCFDLPAAQISELTRKRNGDTPIHRLARQILGVPRHIGLHCGGIVITPSPVRGLAPLEFATKGVIATQYDKDAAEPLGLIKIDLLGNRALSTVNDAVRFANSSRTAAPRLSSLAPAKPPLDVDAIDPEDPQTARMLSLGDSLGVFQCESPGMRQLLRGLKIRNRKDVAIALSLIRPGPAAGGSKAEFIARHIHHKPFTYLHPKMKDIFADTCGVMLYQEDVMRIAVEIAGYTIADADRFRSEVSKRVSAARLQAHYTDFVYHRAEAAGIDRSTAEAIWEQILRFAAYSYCKAHATVYANIAWQTAWLKSAHPVAFYCSIFNNHHGMYPLRVYVWDAIRHGIRILPPHVNFSDAEWSCRGNTIRAGLGIIKGISRTAIEQIITQRALRPFADLADLRSRVSFRRPELHDLIHVGACDHLGPTRPIMLAHAADVPPKPGQRLLFDLYNHTPAGKPLDYDRLARLKAEIDVTAIAFSLHPAVLLRTRHVPAAQLDRYINKTVTVAGFVAAARRAATSDGRTMGFVTIEDHSGLAEVSFFPDQIEQYFEICDYPGPVWVKGRACEHLCSVSIEAQAVGHAA